MYKFRGEREIWHGLFSMGIMVGTVGMVGACQVGRCFNNHYKLLWRRTATATATTVTAADQRTTLLHKKLDKQQKERETATNLRQPKQTTESSNNHVKGFVKLLVQAKEAWEISGKRGKTATQKYNNKQNGKPSTRRVTLSDLVAQRR